MRETWVQSLGQEDPLEKGMATHSSILAWRIHGQKSLEGHSLWGQPSCDPQKSPDTPGSPEGNTEGPGTASSEPLLPS